MKGIDSGERATVALPYHRRLGTLLRLAHCEVRKIGRRALEPVGLDGTQYLILADLFEESAPLPESYFRRKYKLKQGRVLRASVALLDRGLVTRHDGAMTLTETGQSYLSSATALLDKELRDLARGFTDSEWAAGFRFVSTLSALSEKRRPQPLPFRRRNAARAK